MNETPRQAQIRHMREQQDRIRVTAKRTVFAFAAIWAFVIAVSLGFLGLIAWAIVRLVLHFT